MKEVIAVFISLLIGLGVMEVATRSVIDNGLIYELEMWKYAKQVKIRNPDPGIGHSHAPNASARLMQSDVRTDSHGFRGAEIDAVAPAGRARIAFVGDSITFGWGVEEADTFATQVIALLRARGRNVDGFNQGVGNHNTTQEVNLYAAAGATMRPDIVALSYFINDAEPIPRYTDTGLLDWYSAAWVVAKYRIDSLLRLSGETVDWKAYYRDLYRPDAPGWKLTQESLKRFAQMLRQAGTKLILFDIPEIRELTPYPFQDISALVEATARASDIPYVNLLPSVQKMDPPSLWVTVPDPHPNAKAQHAFAEMMVEHLIPMLDELCASANKGCAQ